MEVYSPNEVAQQLKIKPATLRKYSIMLENNGYTINRNSQNHRYYTDKDVMTLKRVITSKSSDVTLEEAINNVISVHDHNTYTNDMHNEITPYNTVMNDDIKQLKEMVQAQSEQIDLQMIYIKELTERIDQQQKYITGQQEQLQLDHKEKKKGFFSKLFNR